MDAKSLLLSGFEVAKRGLDVSGSYRYVEECRYRLSLRPRRNARKEERCMLPA